MRWLEAQYLDSKACKVLFQALERTGRQQAPRALVSLDLRNSRLHDDVDIVAVARASAGLCNLNLARTRLKDDDAVATLTGLLYDPHTGLHSPHQALRSVCFEGNYLTANSASVLAHAMAALPLDTLVLSRNRLGDAGAATLAQALAGEVQEGVDGTSVRLPGLVRLDLSENGLTTAGLIELLKPLARRSSLKILAVGGNELIGDGLGAAPRASELTERLTAARSLEELQLWRCGLTDVGYRILVSSIPSSLKVLGLASNSFSQQLLEHFMHELTWGFASTAVRM